MSLKRCATLLRAATQRTQQIPLQIQQTNPRRAQTGFQHRAARLLPIVGQLVRLDARERKIVRLLDEFNQADRRPPRRQRHRRAVAL